MVGLQSEKVVRVPIAQIAGRRKVVPRDLVDVARSLTV
jgi:hypothetical protein